MDVKNLLTRSRNLLSHPPLWWKENEASRERLIGELDAAIHQEPVAWMYQTKSGFRKCWHFGEQGYPAFIADRAAASEFPEAHSWTPLYTTPQPPVQSRQPLTDEQIAELLDRTFSDNTLQPDDIALIRAIEATHGIKQQP